MQKSKLLVVLLFILGTSTMQAREHVAWAKSQDSFYQRVQGNPFAIALFYADDKKDLVYHEKIKQVLRAFKHSSESRYYKQAGLRFVAVDVDRKALKNFQQEYGIEEVPAFILFQGGAPVRNVKNQLVVLAGFASQERIKNFITKYLQADLEEQLRRDAERREQERAYYGGSAYFGVGYAYDPYYPYYYGNYGYPYGGYGNYYAPGFGVGFSVPL